MSKTKWQTYAKVVPIYHLDKKGSPKCGNKLRGIDKVIKDKGAVTCFLCKD